MTTFESGVLSGDWKHEGIVALLGIAIMISMAILGWWVASLDRKRLEWKAVTYVVPGLALEVELCLHLPEERRISIGTHCVNR